MIPPGAFGGGKPPPAPRVVNTDFFKGKVKSIYEREPLFQVMNFSKYLHIHRIHNIQISKFCNDIILHLCNLGLQSIY